MLGICILCCDDISTPLVSYKKYITTNQCTKFSYAQVDQDQSKSKILLLKLAHEYCQLTAKSGCSAQIKTAPEGAAFD